MKEILKVTLDSKSPKQKIYVKAGADILSIQRQNGNITLWYIHDTEYEDLPDFEMDIRIIYTGEPFQTDKYTRYIGTVIDNNGYVCHVFRGKSSAAKSAEENMRD